MILKEKQRIWHKNETNLNGRIHTGERGVKYTPGNQNTVSDPFAFWINDVFIHHFLKLTRKYK